MGGFTQAFRQYVAVLTCRVNCATLLVQAICTIFWEILQKNVPFGDIETIMPSVTKQM